MIINTVSYLSSLDSPTLNTGYLVNGIKPTDIGSGDRYELAVNEWINDGNIPTPAHTQEQLDIYSLEFTYRELVAQLNTLTVEYEGNIFSGNTEAQSFIIAMIIKIEGEALSATRNIYAINGRLKVPMTKTQLNELISLIDIAQEAITNA